MSLRCAAVLCVRNERAQVRRAITDFVEQGIDVAIIDHESSDGTREICAEFLGKGVLAVESLAWAGAFDLTAQLQAKQDLASRLDHDWLIHADADEWLQSPVPGETLLGGIERLDASGFDAVNFEEFVFLPGNGGIHEPSDCRREFLDYYFFAPGKSRLMRAWRHRKGYTNVDSGGHKLAGGEPSIAGQNFILRHYPVLSQAHAIEKYGSRKFADADLDKGWHHNRLGLDAARLRLPDPCELKHLPDSRSVDFDRSEPRTTHYWDWPRSGGACEVLACIYTCAAHADLLKEFHASELGQFLRGWQGIRVIEVHADPALDQAHFDGIRLTVPGEERYTALSIKTHRMVAECVRRFQFQRLLKIDVTTVLTRMEGPEYVGRTPLDIPALVAFLRGSDRERQYDGFILHAEAGRDGAENWAAKKGSRIDYERLFGTAPMPPFYSGKCYLLGRDFAEFVAASGAGIAAEHEQFFLGAEDVMIGRLHRRYLAGEDT